MANMYDDGSYLDANEGWHQEDSPYKAKFCRQILEKNNLQFSTAVDVGCGAGLVTELLAKSFPQAEFTGYDPSANVSAIWETREKLDNLSYQNKPFDSSCPHVDLAVCLDVFEHVEDYFGFLRELRGNADYHLFNIPLDMNVMKIFYGLQFVRQEVGHLHYYTVYSAIETLKDAGYEIVDQELTATVLSIPPRNKRQMAVLPLRLATLAFGKGFAAKMFGGVSLVVLARNPNT